MNEKFKALRIAHLIIMGLAIAVLILVLIQSPFNNGLLIIGPIFNILALVAGIFYLLLNFTKNSALVYKLYVYILTLFYIFNTVSNQVSEFNMLTLVCGIISVAVLLVLAFWKDLGEMISLLLYIVLVTSVVIWQITILFLTPGLFSIERLVYLIVTLVPLGTLGIMITLKYADKKQRLSK